MWCAAPRRHTSTDGRARIELIPSRDASGMGESIRLVGRSADAPTLEVADIGNGFQVGLDDDGGREDFGRGWRRRLHDLVAAVLEGRTQDVDRYLARWDRDSDPPAPARVARRRGPYV